MQYCTNELCPVKESCKRSICHLTKEESNQDLWMFTESPGAIRVVSGREVWICDKQIKKSKYQFNEEGD